MEGKINSAKTNSKLNANTKKEQNRLRTDFPNDTDIFKCKSSTVQKACYVKGRLMPTYAFGDFHLKFSEFNDPNSKLHSVSSRRTPISPFNGPYIKSEPVITVYEKNGNMHGILIATDGLWDELSKNEVGEIYAKNFNDNEKFLKSVLDTAITKAAMSNMIKKSDLEHMELGKRRSYHDDISIIFVKFD